MGESVKYLLQLLRVDNDRIEYRYKPFFKMDAALIYLIIEFVYVFSK